eukprot:11156819-Lingulodinium_polyedra.AAC.1
MGVSSGPSFPSAALRCSGVGGGPKSSNCLPCPRRRSVRRSMVPCWCSKSAHSASVAYRRCPGAPRM